MTEISKKVYSFNLLMISVTVISKYYSEAKTRHCAALFNSANHHITRFVIVIVEWSIFPWRTGKKKNNDILPG